MKRLAKILLITTAVLAVLLAGGAWYLTRWLRAPETRLLVERELSKALKMPLTFKSLNLSLWGGAEASGVSIQDGGTQFFESNSFTAKHRLMPLFSGKFVFSEITIDSPRFVVVQRSDGSWKLPQLPEEPKAPKPAGEEKKKADSTPKPKSQEPRVLVERLVVTNGEADFYDKEHQPVGSLRNLGIALKDVSEHKVEGRVTASRVVWNGYFGVSDFRAGVSNSKEKGLIIPQFVAKAGGGNITGGYARKPGKPANYSAKIKLEDVDVGRAVLDGEVDAPNLTGLLSANVEVRGVGNDTKQLNGKASVSFKNGTCREIELVNELGTVFQMEQAAQFGIPEARADIVIWNGRMNIKPLSISAPPLGLIATGTANLEGKIKLEARLLADADFVNKRSALAPQFEPADANGQRALPFDVHGTFTKPKHNLLERLTGTKNKDLQRVIAIDAALSTLAEKPNPANPKRPAPAVPAAPSQKP